MDKKVLLINSTGAISLIPGMLVINGYEVDMTSNPETGLHRLYGRSYSLAMVLENPAAESWRFCEKIRSLTDIPIIIISPNANTETCVKAINAGADFFMRKPFGPLELLARIDSLCQRTLPHPAALLSRSSALRTG
jgi:two-component system, OmpR family, response regulator